MKYRQLLLAIEQATTQIRQFEQESRPDIDQVMARLLPQLAGALDAELAFVATPTDTETTVFRDHGFVPGQHAQGTRDRRPPAARSGPRRSRPRDRPPGQRNLGADRGPSDLGRQNGRVGAHADRARRPHRRRLQQDLARRQPLSGLRPSHAGQHCRIGRHWPPRGRRGTGGSWRAIQEHLGRHQPRAGPGTPAAGHRRRCGQGL